MDFEFLDLIPQALEDSSTDTQLLESLAGEDLPVPANKTFGLSGILMFAFSLLDDALLLGLSRLGINVPWLKWLAPIIFVALSYQWIRHGYHFLKNRFSRTVAP
jgi:hypothetical protein